MSERIVSILGRFRARLLLVRSAEAAAVGAAAGALVAAFLMAGRILVDVCPAAAVALSAIPPAAGGVLALAGRLRRKISDRADLQWWVVGLAVACGGAATAWALSGTLVFSGKNWLAAMAPAGGLLAAALVLVRGSSLAAVAATVDRQAGLKDRLATALELVESGDDSIFGDEVRSQGIAAAGDRQLRGVRFWSRTRATVGVLCLALAAVGLMLPWDVIESDASRRKRLWGALAPRAAGAIEDPLVGLDALAADAGLAGEIRKLEALTEGLRGARPADAKEWRGKVVELGAVAEALRRMVRSGKIDAATARRLGDLIEAIEEASAALADGMSEGARYARADPVDPATLPAAGASAPTGWTSFYNPAYAEFARTRAAGTRPPETGPPPSVPFDRQWLQARRAAAESLRRQSVPAEYRRLVRDFFAAEGR